MDAAFVFLAGYLATKFFDWITEKALSIPDFFDIKKKCMPAIQNEALKELLELSIENAIKNERIQQLGTKDIENSLKENMNLLFEWILLSDRSNKSFANYSDKIIILVNRDLFLMLYNTLFYQIQAYKHNYPTLQNLIILDKLDEINNTVTANLELSKETNRLVSSIHQGTIYTGELKEIEEKIRLRQFNDARSSLYSLEHKLLSKGDSDETEKFYQLLTDVYFLDSANQHKAVNSLGKLIIHTTDNSKRKKREILKSLLEQDYNYVQNELDIILAGNSNVEIDQSYFDLQVNAYILQKRYDIAIDFLKANKERISNYPLWICRLYYYQSNVPQAMEIVKENGSFFNKSDFDIQILKIYILSAFHLDEAICKRNIQNITSLKTLIPRINEAIDICRDDIGTKSQMHSVLGLIYSILYEQDNARKEYEKSLELVPDNMNTLKNFPFILINSNNRNDKERALKYIEQYLLEYPDDQLIESLYYNSIVFISPKEAVVKLESYNGSNDDVKPFLLYAYDVLFEFTKAENLIADFLSKENVTSSMYFFIALHYETVKNFNSALDYYFKSLENAETNTDLNRTVDKLFRLVIFLKDKQNTIKGITSIEKIFSPDEIVINFIDLYLPALLLLADYEKCYKYCNMAIEQNILTKNVYESLFSCYYNTQNFQSAFNTIEKYIEIFGQMPLHFLPYIATCCIQTDDLEKAYEFIKYLPMPESVNDYILQVNFFRFIKKDYDALKISHKAYLAFPKSQKIMEMFLTFVLNKGNLIIPEEISADIHNCLSNYIKSDFKGKVINDFYINTQNGSEGIKEQLSNIIPDNKDLIDNLELINEQKLPIVFYKRVINRNLLFIHHFIISQRKVRIWCFDGVFNTDIIKESKTIYMDLGSLLLFDTLNILNSLPDYFAKINISQAVFNEIRNFESEIPPSNEAGILTKDVHGNISFIKDDVPYNEIYEKSKRLIAFIKNNAAVNIVGKPLVTINRLPSDLLKLAEISKTDIDLNLMEYAYLSNIPIMLENMTYRRLFNSLDNTPYAFCVLDYLRFLLASNKMPFDRYCRILSLMSKQNYAFLPFDHNVFYFLIMDNGYIVDDFITHVFEKFMSNDYNKNYVFKNILATLIIIWNAMIPNEIKTKWTDYLMNKLIIFSSLTLYDLNAIDGTISSFIYNNKSRKDFLSFFEKFIFNKYPN